LLLSFTLFKEDIALPFVVGFLVSQGQRALGPICGLSAKQLNKCLPRREEKRREEKRREEKRREEKRSN